MTDLLVVNSVDDIQQFVAINGLHSLSIIDVLAIDPAAQAYLIEHGIKYKRLIDYLGKSVQKELLEESENLFLQLERELDLPFPFNEYKGYKLTFLTCARHAFLSVLYYEKLCNSLVEIKKYERIYISNSIDKELFAFIEMLKKKSFIVCFITPNRTSRISNRQKKFFFKNFIVKISFYLCLAKYCFIKKNKSPLVHTSPHYNLSNFANTVSRDLGGVFLVSLTSSSLIRWIRSFFLRDTLSFLGLPYKLNSKYDAVLINFLENKMSFILDQNSHVSSIVKREFLILVNQYVVPQVVKSYSESKYVEKIFSVRKPTLIFSQMSLGWTAVLGGIANKYGIPNYLISHGSHVPFFDEASRIEWYWHSKILLGECYSNNLIQSPWAFELLNKLKRKNKQISYGPILFSKLDNSPLPYLEHTKNFDHGNFSTVFLHASTYKKVHCKGYRPWVYESFDEYINNINDLIRAVSLINGGYLIIRFRELAGFKSEDVARLLIQSDCYGIYTEGKFSDYLPHADFLFSYSSTTIEEALLNNIPVIQYDGTGSYQHIPCSSITSSDDFDPQDIYYIESQNSLLESLPKIVRAHQSVCHKLEGKFRRHVLTETDKFSWLEN